MAEIEKEAGLERKAEGPKAEDLGRKSKYGRARSGKTGNKRPSGNRKRDGNKKKGKARAKTRSDNRRKSLVNYLLASFIFIFMHFGHYF